MIGHKKVQRFDISELHTLEKLYKVCMLNFIKAEVIEWSLLWKEMKELHVLQACLTPVSHSTTSFGT